MLNNRLRSMGDICSSNIFDSSQLILSRTVGKMINCQLGNTWQARCPFCSATPNDIKAGIDKPTDHSTLVNLPVSPLHVLIRTGEMFHKAGIRNMAGVHKHSERFDRGGLERLAMKERYIYLNEIFW